MGRPTPPFPMPRLSAPFETLRPHYDAVVVGSGYGGGVAAARLARAGLSVCLLERGRELHPGEYPSSLRDALRSFQVHVGGRRARRRETALFDFRVGEGICVLVGCGLGGGSLINANVCLEAQEWVLSEPCWPVELRNDRTTLLRQGIERAREMLGATRFPGSSGDLLKLARLEQVALALGGKLEIPPVAVSFSSGTNRVGIEQVGCRLCGDCVSGCNHGAKNTVLMNYLPYARKHGAAIFTQIRVDWVERRNDRWLVRFERVGSGEDIFRGPSRFVSASRVVLAAGSLGSTEILLRSREKGLPLSAEIGARFSGNGDTTGFAYNAPYPVNGVGLGEARIDERDPVGPCIAGLIDLRDGCGELGIVIEDGSPPGAIARILPPFLALMSIFGGVRELKEKFRLRDRVRARWRQLLSLWRPRGEGAVRNTQTHLVMAHDSAKGKLSLRKPGEKGLSIRFAEVGNEEIFAHVDETLDRAAQALGATPIPNPLWDKIWTRPLRRIWYRLVRRYRPKKRGDRDLVTVHPLGGCAMASSAASGVVNHKHQVFSGEAGSAVHDGLYVMDGAVAPRSLGVNPLLTIAGLAERACHYLLQDEGRPLVGDFPARPLWKEEKRPQTLGLRFSERLAGHVECFAADSEDLDPEDLDSYRETEAAGKAAGTGLSVVLDMEIDDVDVLVESPAHEIRVSGVVEAPQLFDAPAMVVAKQSAAGEVQTSFARILTWSRKRVNLRLMVYRLHVVTEDGARFRIEGEKLVRDHWWPFPLWRETTALYTRVYDSLEREIARGTIHVGFWDFVKQMLTQRPVNARGFLDGCGARWRFNRFFVREVSGHANPLLRPPKRVERGAKRPARRLDAPQPELHPVRTADGFELRLTRHRGGARGPVILSPGLGVSSRIFSIDTIRPNLLEYLCRQGFDVWLLDYRGSTALPEGPLPEFSADEVAKNDYPAAVDKVLEETGSRQAQFVVHCFGATTFFASVLGQRGLDPARVRSVVVSQIATHVVTPLDTRLKVGLHAGSWLYLLGWRHPNVYTDDGAGLRSRALNLLLRFLPLEREERCRSDVCHRISLLYSLLYEHDRLDPETHDALHEMFGAASMRALRHLAEMSRQGRLVGFDGGDVYVPKMRDRLRFPIRFLHGAENHCFLPVSTRITLELLEELQRDRPAAERVAYDRFEIPGYGHIDCIFGSKAHRDVYPLILDHLDRHA